MSIRVEQQSQDLGEMIIMTSIVRRWRDHHRRVRGMHDFARAVENASSHTVRDELLAAAHRQNVFMR